MEEFRNRLARWIVTPMGLLLAGMHIEPWTGVSNDR